MDLSYQLPLDLVNFNWKYIWNDSNSDLCYFGARNFELMVQIQDGREARDMVRLTFLLLQLEQKFWWLG